MSDLILDTSDEHPSNYTLVNIADWCKRTFEVVHELWINTDSYRWEPTEAVGEDMWFKSHRLRAHGIAPKSAADFAFLLHGLHYLKDDGVMPIIQQPTCHLQTFQRHLPKRHVVHNRM